MLVWLATCVAMLDSFAAQLLLQLRHFKGGAAWTFPKGGRCRKAAKP
jgi:hypothetical protein